MTLRDDLNAVVTQLGKAKSEILAKVAELEGQISSLSLQVEANSGAAAELQDASQTLAELKASAQSLDDVVPDAEPGPEV